MLKKLKGGGSPPRAGGGGRRNLANGGAPVATLCGLALATVVGGFGIIRHHRTVTGNGRIVAQSIVVALAATIIFAYRRSGTIILVLLLLVVIVLEIVVVCRQIVLGLQIEVIIIKVGRFCCGLASGLETIVFQGHRYHNALALGLSIGGQGLFANDVGILIVLTL